MHDTTFRIRRDGARFRWPEAPTPKRLGLAVFGVQAPTLAAILWLALAAGLDASLAAAIMLVALAGALLGAGIATLAADATRSRISSAAEALEAYARDRALPGLPAGLGGETGRLFAAVRTAAETAERLLAAQERLASTDALTGLLNRRAFLERAEEERGRFDRHGRPAAIALLDIDHFKRINDAHGHPAGDQVLKSVARILRARTRRQDVAGRVGGEEFAFVFPDTDIGAARTVLAHLREALQGERIPGLESLTVAFSAGLTAFGPGDNSIDDALARADVALYEAKRTGRDQVQVREAAGRTQAEAPVLVAEAA